MMMMMMITIITLPMRAIFFFRKWTPRLRQWLHRSSLLLLVSNMNMIIFVYQVIEMRNPGRYIASLEDSIKSHSFFMLPPRTSPWHCYTQRVKVKAKWHFNSDLKKKTSIDWKKSINWTKIVVDDDDDDYNNIITCASHIFHSNK